MADNQTNFKDTEQWREQSKKALIPFVVFIIFYFGFSVVTQDFSKVPMTVAFIISSAVALILNHKEKLNRKIEIFALGMGKKDIMIMCLVFIMAGAFTATAQAVGGVEAAVSIARHIVPPDFMISGLFVISALISLAIGTSCGTIAAVVPIAVALAQSLGLSPAVLLGAAVGGAMFGDNLSLISDTTIAATRTQNVEMRDKMICNLKIVLVPALLCALLYMLPIFASSNVNNVLAEPVSCDACIKVLPYILLLILGIAGINVMFLLLIGIILNTIIGIYYGIFDIFGAFAYIGDGTVSMATTLIVALLAGGMLQMVRWNGGITYIINKTESLITSKRHCELGICFLVGIINLFTANNTVAIITAGPIAKELTEKYGVDPKRTASLLDTTSCCVQGMLPYGAQILVATGLATSVSISSFSIIKCLYYPVLMGIGILVSLYFTGNDK
ncbi:MAG: Na+/H+ antiporter NhaC family protein [Candidatus Gastranaerophilales bacterium]|nr:Na+/H+ antiporter NhaC family protein [Candidatus Gastranaerophilales bacterium]